MSFRIVKKEIEKELKERERELKEINLVNDNSTFTLSQRHFVDGIIAGLDKASRIISKNEKHGELRPSNDGMKRLSIPEYIDKMYGHNTLVLDPRNSSVKRETVDSRGLMLSTIDTETILNGTVWMDDNNFVHEVSTLSDEYLRTILLHLYRNRDSLWLGCEDINITWDYLDGDSFFNHVIRKSTLWTEISKKLEKESKGFNFRYSTPIE